MKEKKDSGNVFLCALIAIAAIAVAYPVVSGYFSKPVTNANYVQEISYPTKTSQGEVTIDITPKKYEAGLFYIGFDANTHSFDGLSNIDLKKSVTLEYDGRKIGPKSAFQMSGHHNSGTLVFETGYEPERFTITVEGIPDKEKRIFQWVGGE